MVKNTKNNVEWLKKIIDNKYTMTLVLLKTLSNDSKDKSGECCETFQNIEGNEDLHQNVQDNEVKLIKICRTM